MESYTRYLDLEDYYFTFFTITDPDTPSFCLPVLPDQCGTPWQKTYCSFHQSALKSPNNTKFLSYYCDGKGCGGVGNRIRGIVSLFYLAMLTNRTFLIHWGGPGKLEDYLEPNQVAWSLPLNSVGNFRKTYWGVYGPPSGYDMSRIEPEEEFINWTTHADFDGTLSHLDAIGTIWSFSQNLWTNPFLGERARQLGIPDSPRKMLGCAFHFLFKQTGSMKTVLNKARASLARQSPLLGIHIRTSDHHFGVSNPHSYRSRNTSSFFVCAIRQSTFIRDYINPKLTKLKWFLAADDQAVKNMAIKKYRHKIVTLGIKPRHLEYDRTKDTVLRDVLTDAFLLAESNFLILTSTSSLSILVAAVGLHGEETIADGELCLVNATSLIKAMSRFSSRG